MNIKKIIEMGSTPKIIRLIQSNVLPNMYLNFISSTGGSDEFCHQMTEHALSLVNNLNDMIFIISVVGSALASVFTNAMMIYAFVEIRKQERIIIRAFMTILKHVISKIVDTLKINAKNFDEFKTNCSINHQSFQREKENCSKR